MKVETLDHFGSLLLAIIQSLEHHSGRFFRRIYFRHRGLVSLDLLSMGAPLDDGLEMENNLVASDSCHSSRSCQDAAISASLFSRMYLSFF